MSPRAPYFKQFDIEAKAGQDNFFELGMPNRADLVHFKLTQVADTLNGFSADLYHSKRALPAVEVSESSSAGGEPPTVASNYEVIPTQTAASSAATI